VYGPGYTEVSENSDYGSCHRPMQLQRVNYDFTKNISQILHIVNRETISKGPPQRSNPFSTFLYSPPNNTSERSSVESWTLAQAWFFNEHLYYHSVHSDDPSSRAISDNSNCVNPDCLLLLSETRGLASFY